MKEVYCDTCYYCIKSKSKFKCILPNHVKLKISTSECIKEPDITTCSAHKSRNLKMKNEYFMNQLSIFDLIPDEDNKAADICESCRYNENGCCSYDEPLGRYCVEGSAYELKVPETAPQFPESDFAEIVDYLNNKLGVSFQPKEWKPDGCKAYYECKVSKKLKLDLSRSRFSEGVNNGAEFIGVGWNIKTGGGGSPLDTVEEALNYFEKIISEYK